MSMSFSFLKKVIREKMFSDFNHANKSFNLSFSINFMQFDSIRKRKRVFFKNC